MARLNNYILLFIATVSFYGCNKAGDDKKLLLDYSFHSGWTHSYSLKVYANHKAYLMKSASGVDSLYINNQISTNDLEETIVKLSESTVHKKYEDTHIQDAPSFNAIVYYGKDKAATYTVYGNKYPDLLNAVRRYADASLKRDGWYKLKDTTIVFASLANFTVTPKIDTNIKFLPPQNSK